MNKKLNILNLATTDEGGAGIASRNFNDLFSKNGFNSILIVKESKSKNNNVITFIDKSHKYAPFLFIKKIKNTLVKKIDNLKIGKLDSKYFYYNFDESKEIVSADQILKKTPFIPDIIIIHWVANFINIFTIKKLAGITKAKTYWIMMDNAPLTGGCHYPWECKGYQINCADCPAILDPLKKIISQKNLAIKKQNLPENLELIAFSDFDYKRAKESVLFQNKNVHKMLSPIDETKFMVGDKLKAKAHFGIRPEQKVIFYGSISLNNKRKGGQYFLAAINKLQCFLINEKKNLDDYVILIAGIDRNNLFNDIKIPVIQSRYMSESILIKAYQAAQVFVSTSLEDSGPTMINQSIMCGTPVVSFEMGVALDLVNTGFTGYRVKMCDSIDLAIGIYTIVNLKPEEYSTMSKNCEDLALTSYSYKNINSQFKKIFFPEI
jgi:glycosyltransferase involved in cell wall biosynthesis